MFNFIKAFSFTFFCATAWSSISFSQVYIENRSWDESSELEYQNWVRTHWNKDFFRQDNPYKGIFVDCADAVYGMRAVFAMENGLPFVMNDPTGGRRLITNRMNRWDHLPLEQRKRQFLLYLFNMGSTRSLSNDSYPAAINSTAINSGSFILTDKLSHHSWTIQSVSSRGVPHLLYGTVPAVNQLKVRNDVPTAGFMFPEGISSVSQGGFRNFKSPSMMQIPDFQIPGYSLEQYSIPASSWQSAIQKRLSSVQETPEEKTVRILENVCQEGKDRIHSVNEGLNFLNQIGRNRCLTAAEFDLHSTPGRDRRFLDAVNDLEKHVREIELTVPQTSNWRRARNLIENRPISDFCPLPVRRGQVLRLADAVTRLKAGRLSSNPNDPFEARWGYSGPSSQAVNCPEY